MKYSNGFTRMWPTIGTAVSLVASMALLGVALFGEPLTAGRIVCIGLIVSGIAGLRILA